MSTIIILSNPIFKLAYISNFSNADYLLLSMQLQARLEGMSFNEQLLIELITSSYKQAMLLPFKNVVSLEKENLPTVP